MQFIMKNPFVVKTPESLEPQEIADLFIDVFSDFPKIKDVGHTFIHGPRGTGKSMMLKYLEPSVQLCAGKVEKIEELDFLAVHIPFKVAALNIRETDRLRGDSHIYMSEHLMVLHIASILLSLLSKLYDKEKNHTGEVQDIYKKFSKLITTSGASISKKSEQSFLSMAECCDEEKKKAIQYLKHLAFIKDEVPYTGSLCGYVDFFQPLAKEIKELPFTPNCPIYLMLDDADNSSETMQKILNTWVSCRTTQYLCIKISTQLRYKTYRTLSGQLIEAPHDYSDVDISTLYTSDKEHYQSRIRSIVGKRLSVAGIKTTPEEYFSVDEKQEKKINIFKEKLKKEWGNGKGRGYRASDDVVRYAVPDYMKSLGKSSSTYSYAGFKNIVDISSGVIRFFLEPAAQMYAETKAQQNEDAYVSSIPCSIQDSVIKQWSSDFILSEFEKLKKDVNTNGVTTGVTTSASHSEDTNIVSKLFSLINGLGKLFRELVLSNGSQRRIFSISVRGEMDETLQRIFELGVEWGYFHKSVGPSKEGSGRRYTFVLSRRLAPYFKLDISSYAGEISVTTADLNLACEDYERFVRERMKKITKELSDAQIDIFQTNIG